MSVQQFFIYIVILGVIYASYCSYRAKNKIYCTFTRRDKTVGHRWIKVHKNGERIEYGGGWYYVDSDCITTEALDSGFNMIFPTMVRRLEFTWGHQLPINPKTGLPIVQTPEMRKNLNKREDIEALELGSKQALSGKAAKVGLLGGGWMPIIIIVGLLVVGYMEYQNQKRMDAVGLAINTLQQMMMGK